MNITAMANSWCYNRAVTYEWANRYAERTGLTLDDVMQDRLNNAIHDSSAEKIATIEGFELSVCPMGQMFRYTVLTPWMMHEGLIDRYGRDDEGDKYVISILRQIVEKLKEDPYRCLNYREPRKPIGTQSKTTSQPKAPSKPRQRSQTKPKAKPKARKPKDETKKTPKPKAKVKDKSLVIQSSRFDLHVPLYDEKVVNDESLVVWKHRDDGTYKPMGIWVKDGERYVVGENTFDHLSLIDDYILAEFGKIPQEVMDATLRSLRWI